MMPRRVAEAVALATLAGGLAGCAGPRQLSTSQGAGGAWEAVLPGVRVAELSGEGQEPAWYASRNDEHLNVRPAEPILATTSWPQPERPSLRRPVFVRIYRQPEGFIYYRTEERYEYRRDW